MEFVYNTPSPTRNLADEINSLKKNIIQTDSRIKKYKITIANMNSQKYLQEYLDMLESYKDDNDENFVRLKHKIKELINHPLNKASPSRKRKRTPSRGGTRKHRRKTVRR